MTITLNEIHTIMHKFYCQHQRLPNTILLPPATDHPENVSSAMCVNVIFAAVPEPVAAVL